jgi:uncharacterized protein (TIGR02722 family)
MTSISKKVLQALCFGTLFAPLACTDSFQGEYANPKEQEIVDDRWNPTDASKTAETIIKAVVSKNWLIEFMQANGGKKPIVIVDDIENRTNEHIDTAAIGQDLQNELINSGKIRFFDKAARDKILKEIKYHNESGMVSETSAKKKGKQIGADFLMVGEITGIENVMKGYKTVTYTTTVRLTNLDTSEILFSESYQIKKKFKRSGAGF